MPTPCPDRPNRLQSPVLWRRGALAVVVGLALLTGALAPHGSSAEHRESPTGAAVDRSARHPGEPLHLEASTVEFQSGCPLCVLQLQTVTVLKAPRTALLPPPAPRGSVIVAAQQAHSAPAALFGPARAPPVLSSAL